MKWLGVPNVMVQPPLPEGDPREVLCGTNAWYKVAASIYSPKAKLVWIDLKQQGNEAEGENKHWWPGIRRWHVGLWLQNARLEFADPEVLRM